MGGDTPATTGDSVEKWLRDGEPDWAAIDFALPCSRCGYELRMLTVPRCPECGLTFEWPEILTARLRENEFLFEFRWRQQPIRSYLRTLWRSLWPRRFWTDVSIHDRIRAGPLLFLFLTAPLLHVAVTHGTAALLWAALAIVSLASEALGVGLPPLIRDVQWSAEALTLLPFEMGIGYLIIPGLAFVLNACALALLCSLRQTLGRCRVRLVQVLRVGAYAAGTTSVFWALLFLLYSVVSYVSVDVPWIFSFAVSFLLPPTVHGALLGIGLRVYLQLPRAWLLGLTAAGVALLFTVTTMLVLTVRLAG